MGIRSQRSSIAQEIENFVMRGGAILPRIKNVMAVFPGTKFYSFDSAVSHMAGPAGYFLNAAGIHLGDDLLLSYRENVGGSDHAVRVNNRINEALGTRYQYKDNDRFYNALPHKNPALFEIPGNKFSVRASEVAALLPYLIKENTWLKNTFGEGFYDEEIKFNNDPLLLDDNTRQFLIDNFNSAEQPIKQIVEGYLAEH